MRALCRRLRPLALGRHRPGARTLSTCSSFVESSPWNLAGNSRIRAKNSVHGCHPMDNLDSSTMSSTRLTGSAVLTPWTPYSWMTCTADMTTSLLRYGAALPTRLPGHNARTASTGLLSNLHKAVTQQSKPGPPCPRSRGMLMLPPTLRSSMRIYGTAWNAIFRCLRLHRVIL